MKLRVLLSFGLLCAPLCAQDLTRETQPPGELRVKVLQGEDPVLLGCKLGPKGELHCESSRELVKLECFSTHFGVERKVRSQFVAREVTCDGTLLDSKSIWDQWRIRMLSDQGTRSEYWIESARPEQAEKMYHLELNAQPEVERSGLKRYRFGIGGAELSQSSKIYANFMIELGVEDLDFRAQYMRSLNQDSAESNIPQLFSIALDKDFNDLRFLGSALFVGVESGEVAFSSSLKNWSNAALVGGKLDLGRIRARVGLGPVWWVIHGQNFGMRTAADLEFRLFGNLALNPSLSWDYVSGNSDALSAPSAGALQARLNVSYRSPW